MDRKAETWLRNDSRCLTEVGRARAIASREA
jgi:hypothetical protein